MNRALRYPVRQKFKQMKATTMCDNSRADLVCFLAERYDNKSKIKLGGFRSQLQATYVSSHTEELWFNETVYLLRERERERERERSNKIATYFYVMNTFTKPVANAPPRGYSTLTKEFKAATRISRSSSIEQSTLLSGKAKM